MKVKRSFNDKARRLLGWEPKVDFKDGARNFIKWYREKYAI